MIPRNTWPHTHRDLVQHYYTLHDAAVESGKYEPWVYPWGTLGATFVIIYLLIDHRKRPWLRRARFLVFAVNLLYSIYTIKYVRAKNVAMTMGVGLITLWSSIWVFTILVCYDAQKDFMRIERLEGVFRGRKAGEKGGNNTDTGETTSNGTTPISSNTKGQLGPSHRTGEYAWQPYPLTPFIERVDWVLDIFCNFRGAGWSWRSAAIPPPPKLIQLQLIRNTPPFPSLPPNAFKRHPFQPRTHATHHTLLISNLKTLFAGYIILDILKTFIIHDPYFWGLVDSLPAPYLPYTPLLTTYPSLLRILRLAISQFAILYALQTIFSLGPLFFVGLLGTERLGARGEAWMYPDAWGPYTAVLDRGLIGWWSGWWHQTFRVGFEAPSRAILSTMGKNMNRKSPAARAMQLIMAFGLSAALHATGSFTSHGSTYPLSGSLLFFILQGLGCFIEAILRPLIFPSASFSSSSSNKLPRWLNRALTFVYVYVWLYFTAGLLCDDFARGGVWLLEPVPVSILRGPLGLGVTGDSWWCWGDMGISWYRDPKAWYKSGLAL
ncbi:hypothetical protein DM02DRAFT_512015 [Periconia macrospinosa]|uniref:Wax synthase domain-containing protein n=1 Tax=Periconia macrospinosa TaxID=97972 RepID=A0A2V1EAQ7_9PLEO|nr:hypothetical protein DM02DRAFT_512015 [Periconia macrospinosa]